MGISRLVSPTGYTAWKAPSRSSVSARSMVSRLWVVPFESTHAVHAQVHTWSHLGAGLRLFETKVKMMNLSLNWLVSWQLALHLSLVSTSHMLQYLCTLIIHCQVPDFFVLSSCVKDRVHCCYLRCHLADCWGQEESDRKASWLALENSWKCHGF